jgi:hypothetical protein
MFFIQTETVLHMHWKKQITVLLFFKFLEDKQELFTEWMETFPEFDVF